MKRLFYLFMVFSCMLAGCSKNNNHLDDPDLPIGVMLEVETKKYTIPQEGQKLGVKLETDMEYDVMIPNSATSWVRLMETRAVRTDSLIFQISANAGTQDRSAQIVIKGKRSELSDTLHFIQYWKGITYVGDVVFETEQDLIDFFEAGYAKVQGSVTIQGEELETLQQLGNRLTEIDVSLVLNSSSLTSLEGLSGLTKIGGSLNVYRGKLTSFKGLENLESIGRAFMLYSGSASFIASSSFESFNTLSSFKGLGSLKSIGGEFRLESHNDISSFNALKSFEGLEKLETIGDFNVYTLSSSCFEALSSFKGLSSLKNIDDWFTLWPSKDGATAFNALESFEGLENLETIGGNFTLNTPRDGYAFNALSSFKGLGSLKSIGRFQFGSSLSSSFASLKSFEGLENLETIRGTFSVGDSPALSSFKGLGNLKSVQSLMVSNCPVSSLKGLDNLKNIEEAFYLGPLKVLESLEGLENLQSIRYIRINDCPLLSDFCLLENAIRNMTGTLFEIKGNGYNPTKEMILNGQCSKN